MGKKSRINKEEAEKKIPDNGNVWSLLSGQGHNKVKEGIPPIIESIAHILYRFFQYPKAKISQRHRKFSFPLPALLNPSKILRKISNEHRIWINDMPQLVHIFIKLRVISEPLESNFGPKILDPKGSTKRALFYFKVSMTKKLKQQPWKDIFKITCMDDFSFFLNYAMNVIN